MIVSCDVQARKKSDLKFSWEERDRARMGEDWSLQKVRLITNHANIQI